MIDIAGRHGLDQEVTEPTRIQGETENTLEILFTNIPTLINRVEIMPSLNLADDETVFQKISAVPRLNTKSARTIRKYTKMDLPMLNITYSRVQNLLRCLNVQMSCQQESYRN